VANKRKPVRRISGITESLVRYWQKSIADGEQSRITLFEVGSSSREIPLQDIRGGRTDHRLFASLVERGNNRKSQGREARSQRVLLCPLRLRKRDRDEPGPTSLELLWIPADLHPDGQLTAPENGEPFIPRDLLEPSVSAHHPAIASGEDVEKFFESRRALLDPAWPEYFQLAQTFFEAVTGKPMEAFELEGYEQKKTGLILPDSGGSGYLALTRIYDDILSGLRDPGLLNAIATLKEPAIKNFSRKLKTIHESTCKHLGHFDNRFSLAPSQRRAVHRFFETPQGSILCVTGPPGTGKTTYIQSIVASLWVDAARRGAAHPPIIVACGSTNQSMTNIIDSFSKAGSGSGPEAERWIPGVTSYGTYCCSERRAEDAQEYHLELRSGAGLSRTMETPEFLSRAEREFLSKSVKFHPRADTPKKAADLLQKELRKIHAVIFAESWRTKNGGFKESIRRMLGWSPYPTVDEYFEALSKLDIPARHRAFLLATHYWEARWLQAAAAELKRRRRDDDSSPRFRRGANDWGLRAMITPVFVATLAMAGRFFGGRPDSNEPPIDVLIYDEAGQIPPELGAAVCALGKKGVFVGDDKQLEPVWNVAPHVDKANAVQNRLLKPGDGEGWEKLAKRGVLASRSNFMELTLRSSPRMDGNTRGVFLSEHRRSTPEIVQFCNALAYGGRLEARRPPMTNRILPAFGYVNVEGVDEKRGSSRLNRIEVKAIAAWIEGNEKRILKFYGAKRLSDIVAVISPFSAQIRELERALLRKYPEMTVGTVHGLQGAERPVVVFSSVYDEPMPYGFAFDRGINMLNVAVSRAKDSFIVFGKMSIFNPNSETPSGKLAQFLFASPQNGIDSVNVRRQVLPEDSITRLSSLDEHRNILFEALTSARNRVVIVSPTISVVAIKQDQIDRYISEACSRGIDVTIYTDIQMDLRDGELQERAVEGRELLQRTGAKLVLVDRIHNKSLVIDDHTLVEGSFNWLSASRREGSAHQNFETSFCHRGPGTTALIDSLLADMRLRAARGGVAQ